MKRLMVWACLWSAGAGISVGLGAEEAAHGSWWWLAFDIPVAATNALLAAYEVRKAAEVVRVALRLAARGRG